MRKIIMMLKTKKQERTNEGITLITLIITIIVLLILAGVSISTFTGENGILIKANTAKEENNKAKYTELLKMIQTDLQMQKITNNWNTDKLVEEFLEELENKNEFDGSTIEKKEDGIIKVTTPEGDVFEIKDGSIEYIGTLGENKPPDLQGSDIKFVIEPSKWTNTNVVVRISTKIEGYTLQYSLEGVTWSNYVGDITIKENQAIYTRLINHLGETGGYTTGNITNIDRLSPQQFIPTATVTTNSITLTGNTIDAEKTQQNECSGIAKYYFSNNDGATWVPEAGQINTSYTFSGLSSGTTYNLKMKAVDNAGNEIITERIQKTTNKPISILRAGNYVNYIDKTGTTRKCIVLYDSTSNYGIQIITEGIITNMTVGNATNYDSAKNAWNNLISTLNAKATEYLNTNYASSARCVGSVPNNPNFETTTYYNYTGELAQYFQYNNQLKNADTNSETDKNQLNKIGSLKINDFYWFASRKINVSTILHNIELNVERSQKENYWSSNEENTLIYFGIRSGQAYFFTSQGAKTAGFRPVFTLKTNISIIGGQGTSDSPYILGI